MNKEDLEYFKKKLLDEKTNLESELKTVGHINPDNPGDWEPNPSHTNQRESDPNKRADSMEEYETNTAILKQLETQLMDVKDALEKIDKGTYGICEDTGEQMPRGRLEANPAARTCEVKQQR